MRVGLGWDVHRLAPGRRLVLGGVVIPYRLGLVGHSDADVLTHAVMDALLGAAGLGDIGLHFPDQDPAYRDACSLELLRCVVTALRREGWKPCQVDTVVLAEKPRLAPYRREMQGNLARAMGLEPGSVGVKATTTEGLGFVGNEEGLAAQAVALLSELSG